MELIQNAKASTDLQLFQSQKRKMAMIGAVWQSTSRDDRQSLLDIVQARSRFSKQGFKIEIFKNFNFFLAVGRMRRLTLLEIFIATLVLQFRMELLLLGVLFLEMET
jgi:hypothetical protein